MSTQHISIVRGTPENTEDFSRLVVMSGELLAAIYDSKTETLMAQLNKLPDNLYSYVNTSFLKVNDTMVGMLLAYSQLTARGQQKNTNTLIIKNLGLLGYYLRLWRMITTHNFMGDPFDHNEYTISNIAVDPEFRNHGFGGALIKEAVQQARQASCSSVTLDVSSSNTSAIRFYEKNGFVALQKRPPFKVNGRQFIFYKMVLKTTSSKS